MNKFKVEYFDADANEWIHSSWHKYAYNAIANADVLFTSRACHSRVILGGKIVYEAKE